MSAALITLAVIGTAAAYNAFVMAIAGRARRGARQ